MEIDVGSAIEVVEREMYKRVEQRETNNNNIKKYIAGVVAKEQQEQLKHIIKREIDSKYMKGDDTIK